MAARRPQMARTLHLKPTDAGPTMEVEIAARPYEVVGAATRKMFEAEIDPEDVHVVAAADPDLAGRQPRAARNS